MSKLYCNTFFLLSAFTAYFFATATKSKRVRIGLYMLSAFFIAFSTGTKEIIVVLPALLILFDWFLIAQGEWRSFKKRIPVLGLMCCVFCFSFYKVGVLKIQFLKATAPKPVANNRGNTLTEKKTKPITPSNYFISQFKVMVHYAAMFFWPFNISFDYDMRLAKGFWSADVIFPLLFLILLFFLCLWLFILDPGNLIPFTLGWFFISIFPRASFYPCTEMVCDYKTYIGSFGMMFLLGYLLLLLITFLREHFAFFTHVKHQIIVASLFILALGFVTKQRNLVWSSEELFWKDCIRSAPTKARGWNNYAVAFWEKGDKESAIKHFSKAIELDQNYGEPHVNLGTIYHISGKRDKAFQHYKKAVETGEGHPQLYFNLGMLHLENKNEFSAEYCFKQAISLQSYYSKAYIQLGKLYQAQKKNDDAIKIYQTGFNNAPESGELRFSLALLYHDVGRYNESYPLFKSINSNAVDIAFYMGSCCYNTRNYAQAAQHFGQAHSMDRNNFVYLYNYAQALLNCGQFKQAIPLYERCKDRHDLYAYAPLHLARCFHETGQQQKALQTLDKALKTTPHQHVKKDVVSMINQIKAQGESHDT